MDFFYASRADARKFVEFLQSVVPCRLVLNIESIQIGLLYHVYLVHMGQVTSLAHTAAGA